MARMKFHFLFLVVISFLFLGTGTAAAENSGYYPKECQDLSGLTSHEQDLVKFVCQAKAFTLDKIKELGEKAGLEAAYKEFDKQAGDPECKAGNCQFQKGELYIYAYENGLKGDQVVKIFCRAHGAAPDLVGKDLFDAGYAIEAFPKYGIKKQTDAKFIRMISDAAYRKNGLTDGFSLFTWPNPLDNNSIWLKKGYATRITDTVWLGSGIYIEKVKP